MLLIGKDPFDMVPGKKSMHYFGCKYRTDNLMEGAMWSTIVLALEYF